MGTFQKSRKNLFKMFINRIKQSKVIKNLFFAKDNFLQIFLFTFSRTKEFSKSSQLRKVSSDIVYRSLYGEPVMRLDLAAQLPQEIYRTEKLRLKGTFKREHSVVSTASSIGITIVYCVYVSGCLYLHQLHLRKIMTIKYNLKKSMAKCKFLNVAQELCFQNITVNFFFTIHKNLEIKQFIYLLKVCCPEKI